MTTKEIIKITKTLHLLYAEDDEKMMSSSIELFKNFFTEITTADDGREALEKYEAEKFDIIITDISMPNMDGIELIRHIRTHNPQIPIIVYSAWNDPTYISACISLNVDGYLLKPMQSKNIIEVLEKVSYRIENSFLKNRDIKTHIKQESDFIKEEFSVDALTGLKSHHKLNEHIKNLQALQIPVILLINIDEFHIYNELYGLDVGDVILRQFAKNIEQFLQNRSYELYRIGGDEFVLFESVEYIDPEHYTEDVEALFEFINKHPIVLADIKEPITLSITVGVSFDSDNSYGKANMALHEARRRGRHYLGFSTDADRRKKLQNNLYWREEITKALAQNRVHAFYQKIVNADEKTVKYESLIRIEQLQDDGNTTFITPKKFLDFSKVSKQYIDLTTVMIKETFKSMIKHNVHIAINLSYHDIVNRDINKLLREQISKHQLASKTKFDISSQVIFELTENPNSENYDHLIKFVKEFKALGVIIAIDNFGLRFSNMSTITGLLPHYVKIDGSLIKNIDTDKHSYSLVKAIVQFMKELGIKTIAQHVSSKTIFEISKTLGIDEFQGYYFGEPCASLENEGSHDVK